MVGAPTRCIGQRNHLNLSLRAGGLVPAGSDDSKPDRDRWCQEFSNRPNILNPNSRLATLLSRFVATPPLPHRESLGFYSASASSGSVAIPSPKLRIGPRP